MPLGRPKTIPDRQEAAKEMVSRILSETPISFSDAAKEIHNATGIRPDRATIMRWHRRGIGKNKLRLDAVRITREYITSIEALNRFLSARTAAGL
jgi:hypothetical protein